MAVTCGFFNGADRAANATDVCSIFDGLISDGIYDTIGDVFAVTAAGENFLNLGTGRAWFNHTWTKNDAIVVYEAPAAELLLNRYDCMVLEVDHSDAVRHNQIFILSGAPASSPSLPALSNGPLKFQYLLASIYRPAGSTEILSINITPYQGSVQTPFVNALVEKFDIAAILTQYSDRAMELIDDLEAAYQLIQETGIPPHAATHGTGSSDPLSPESIGAATTSHTHTPDSLGTYGVSELDSNFRVKSSELLPLFVAKSATFTLVEGDDQNKIIVTSNTISGTIPPNVFVVGSMLVFMVASGVFTLTPGSGVVFDKVDGYSAAPAFGVMCAIQRSTNRWAICGGRQ